MEEGVVPWTGRGGIGPLLHGGVGGLGGTAGTKLVVKVTRPRANTEGLAMVGHGYI